jgi:release factor glutamine methyltransferase
MTQAPRTVAEVLNAATDYLVGRKVDEPRLAVEHLLCRLLNCKRLELSVKHRQVLSDKQLEAMRRGTKRVAGGEPIQYVMGQWDFMGHTFKVDRRALIPRPETEILVEQVLKNGALWDREKPAVVDIGTGSGCIIISLALAKPEGLYLAVDVSEEALELARENAAALGAGTRIAFSLDELCDLIDPASVDAIVANLPYVTTSDYERLPPHIRNHEPRGALDAGPTGLEAIELAVQDASLALKPGGLLFLEIGDTQGAAVSRLLEDAGFDQIAITKDLAGHDRVVSGIQPV